jgi:hypothetical protein
VVDRGMSDEDDNDNDGEVIVRKCSNYYPEA